MATLLRTVRSCDACSRRTHVSQHQLLVPRRRNADWFWEWHQAWFCSPCQAPLVDLFHRAHEKVVEITRAG